MFGDRLDNVVAALVAALVEYCTQLLPLLVLYSHMSQVVFEEAEKYIPLAEMLEMVPIDMTGALLSIWLRVTVCFAEQFPGPYPPDAIAAEADISIDKAPLEL